MGTCKLDIHLKVKLLTASSKNFSKKKKLDIHLKVKLLTALPLFA